MQSKWQSLLETLVSVVTGLIISLIIQTLIMKYYLKIEVSHTDNLIITIIFTVASVIRGYVIRRIFNRFHRGNK